MKVGISYINSVAIQSEMAKDGYTTAELLGTFRHPTRDGSDWEIRIFRAADSLVAETNGDPVWEHQSEWEVLLAEYGISMDELKKASE